MPHVEGVPGFDAIELHSGNKPSDTHGCGLVGYTWSTDYVGQSRAALEALLVKMRIAADPQATLNDWIAREQQAAQHPEHAPVWNIGRITYLDPKEDPPADLGGEISI